ncbi:shikimate dehydrogenase [Allokutzneria albata]|uniref:Shikimate dehydrogenase n=1 Tax=Allokutzneria albata TaxID=211114 RepID=A0A1H0DJZ2_ALLAB|nr:shikimate dehydrogenase [Allokutzneria albata]SDN70321.1 shikimate dehydrogenase [Allokutzneria albata]
MVRKAAILGSPVEHSLSPVLHRAAFEALGLTGWTYERIECSEDALPGLVGGLGPEWAGLSVTMPGKRAALTLASRVTPRARMAGAANTLVPIDGGWQADSTDVDGVVGALRAAAGFTIAAGPAVILGAGGTTQAALVGLAELGVRQVRLVVRDPARAVEALACAERLRLAVTVVNWADADPAKLVDGCSVLISTVPTAAVEPWVTELAEAPSVLDVIYHPWPTPLAAAAEKAGNPVATGLDMLLHQAFGQSELFTGRPAPREAMRSALREATGYVLPLPLG